MEAIQTREEPNGSSAFLRLISNNPDGDGLMQAFCLGPMAAYGAASAALHTVDDERQNLLLAGHHGFSAHISKFESIPVAWDFPATRVFHSGEAHFVPAGEINRDFPLLASGRALLTDDPNDDTHAAATVVSLPVVYEGTLTAVCTVLCGHDGRWTWPDFAFVDGLCAALSLWQRIRTLSARQVTLITNGASQRIPLGGLTERQQSVLALIREGKSNASIAKALGYSISTVKNEVQTLIALLGATNRRDVVDRADRAGIARPGAGST